MRIRIGSRTTIIMAIIGSCIKFAAAETETTSAKCMHIAEYKTAQLQGAYRDGALAALATAYARLGDFEKIEPTVARMVDDKFKAQALLNAENYSNIRKQNRALALHLLLIAKETAARVRNQAVRDNLYWQIAGHEAQNGDIERAFATSRLIEDLRQYDQTLYQISAAQGQNGDLRGAQLTAEMIRPGRWREDAFANIAGASATPTDQFVARKIIKEGPASSSASFFMVTKISKTQNYEAALALAREISNTGQRELSLQWIARIAAERGNTDVAARAYREARTLAQHPYQLAEIGVGQAKASLIEDALVTADAIEKFPFRQRMMMNGNDLVWVYSEIVKAQAKAGHLDDARRTIDRMRQSSAYGGPNPEQWLTLDTIPLAVAIGDFQMARKLAAELPMGELYQKTGYKVLHTYKSMAIGLATAGDFEGAAAIVTEVELLTGRADGTDSSYTDEMFLEIALEQARQNNLDRAFKSIARIRRPVTQINALTKIAIATK